MKLLLFFGVPPVFGLLNCLLSGSFFSDGHSFVANGTEEGTCLVSWKRELLPDGTVHSIRINREKRGTTSFFGLFFNLAA